MSGKRYDLPPRHYARLTKVIKPPPYSPLYLRQYIFPYYHTPKLPASSCHRLVVAFMFLFSSSTIKTYPNSVTFHFNTHHCYTYLIAHRSIFIMNAHFLPFLSTIFVSCGRKLRVNKEVDASSPQHRNSPATSHRQQKFSSPES